DHAVEAAGLRRSRGRQAGIEDLGKGGAPVEGLGGQAGRQIGGGRDDGIAAAQVGVEVVQGPVGAGGLEPQRELGDFNRLGADVDAEEVVGENVAVEVEEFGLTAAQRGELVVGAGVLG